MTAPAWCPNFGVDCAFPDCTLLEAECATANATIQPTEPPNIAFEMSQTQEPQSVRVVPPTKPGEMPTLFPITADEIFKK